MTVAHDRGPAWRMCWHSVPGSQPPSLPLPSPSPPWPCGPLTPRHLGDWFPGGLAGPTRPAWLGGLRGPHHHSTGALAARPPAAGSHLVFLSAAWPQLLRSSLLRGPGCGGLGLLRRSRRGGSGPAPCTGLCDLCPLPSMRPRSLGLSVPQCPRLSLLLTSRLMCRMTQDSVGTQPVESAVDSVTLVCHFYQMLQRETQLIPMTNSFHLIYGIEVKLLRFLSWLVKQRCDFGDSRVVAKTASSVPC